MRIWSERHIQELIAGNRGNGGSVFPASLDQTELLCVSNPNNEVTAELYDFEATSVDSCKFTLKIRSWERMQTGATIWVFPPIGAVTTDVATMVALGSAAQAFQSLPEWIEDLSGSTELAIQYDNIQDMLSEEAGYYGDELILSFTPRRSGRYGYNIEVDNYVTSNKVTVKVTPVTTIDF